MISVTHTHLHWHTPLPGTKSSLSLLPQRVWLELVREEQTVGWRGEGKNVSGIAARDGKRKGEEQWGKRSLKTKKTTAAEVKTEQENNRTIIFNAWGWYAWTWSIHLMWFLLGDNIVYTHVLLWLTYVGVIQHLHDPHLPEELPETTDCCVTHATFEVKVSVVQMYTFLNK